MAGIKEFVPGCRVFNLRTGKTGRLLYVDDGGSCYCHFGEAPEHFVLVISAYSPSVLRRLVGKGLNGSWPECRNKLKPRGRSFGNPVHPSRRASTLP